MRKPKANCRYLQTVSTQKEFQKENTHIRPKTLVEKLRKKYHLGYLKVGKKIPVAERSKAWACSRSPAGIAGSNDSGGMDVCVLSGRGLCDGLITHPEESYRLCRVIVYDLETARTRKLKPTSGLSKASKRRRRKVGKKIRQNVSSRNR